MSLFFVMWWCKDYEGFGAWELESVDVVLKGKK
jgi:hypothetical protein